MIYEETLPGRPAPDLLETVEQDLSIIRRDLLAVLQETAHVRASMTEFSSWKPAVSRRFIVVSGVVCFIIASALVVYQSQVREWVQHIGSRAFMSYS